MNSAGRKAFEACDVKVVELKDFVYKNGNEGEAVQSPNSSEDTRTYFGSAAVLHCPRTDDDRVSIESQYTNHHSKLDAYKSVRELAGTLLCRECRYASMTPVEVSIERRNFAKAEAERVEAYLALVLARQEIAHLLDPGQESPQLPDYSAPVPFHLPQKNEAGEA